ncbi:MAG TPA: IS1595 family transposase, partial [Candidatus Pacebacteria bacterium]|nr:IS1595 family transposase [Candidatus Paceibacterota bacterium]
MTHTHIFERKFREILRYFCADETASKTSHYTRIGRKTINRIFNLLRKRILELTIEDDQQISGEIELDESYFGPKRIRGKRGRGASHKIPVLGLLKR